MKLKLVQIFMLLLIGVELATAKERPNVILIVADDLGYNDLGCYGAEGFKTPHLDQLASLGLQLTQYYAGSSVCSASRAALLTGCFPVRIGIHGVIGIRANYGLNLKEWTLAEALQKAGYHTGLFGKWHLGNQQVFRPSKHGFDENYGTIGSNDMGKHRDLELRRLGKCGVEVLEGDEVVETNPDQRFLTRNTTSRAIDFIKRHADDPFFVYLPYNMPHTPLFVSPEWEGSSENGLYGDVIQELDHEIGRILETLDKKGISDDTIVIFTSDNGPWLIFGNHGGSADPFRGGKKESLEGGVRVPCIVRYPSKIKAGRSSAQLVSAVDLAPTIIKWCGAEEATLKIDGLDMRRHFEQPHEIKSPRNFLPYYDSDKLVAVRDERFKLIFEHTNKQTPDPDKIGHDGQRGAVHAVRLPQALYNLSEDPFETHDLQSKYPEIVETLKKKAQAFRFRLGDQLQSVKGKECRNPGFAKKEVIPGKGINKASLK